MTITEKIFQNYINDPLLTEKNYITKERLKNLKFNVDSGVKIIEIIKIAINKSENNDTVNLISRGINVYLNNNI